ncbi:MAG: InlB B-repeat-containing protein [Clostridia bacterium]|nr:InlB B-repeat-containing protein [Clostridia bacterium]
MAGETVVEVPYGTELYTVAHPEVEAEAGYEFIGWTPAYGVLTEDTTVNANFDRFSYTVNFVDYDGTVLKTEEVFYGDAATAPVVEDREGYEFIGWDKNFDNVTEDMTVTAQYKQIMVDVTFVAEHGTMTGETTVTVPYGTELYTVTFPEVEAYEGYIFTGWEPKYGVLTENTTVEAQFDKKQYTVVFADHYGETLDVQYVEHGEGATAPEAPEVEGYKFIGWDKSFDNITGDTVVTAVYEKLIVKVTFVAEHGTMAGDTVVEVPYGTELYTVAHPEVTANEGYKFIGWEPVNETLTADTTVTAKFDRLSFTVSFIDHDGTVLKTEEVFYGDAATAPVVEDREGYEFIGWDGSFDNVTEDTTITAVYEQIMVDVTFVAEHGTLAGETVISVPYGTELDTVAHPEVTANEGYTFIGWAPASATLTEDTIVTAQFDRISYTLTFLGQTGEVVDEVVVFHGDDATAPAAPEVENYSFIGWAAEDGDIVTEFTNVTADATYNAVYKLNTYNVSFVAADGGSLEGTTEYTLTVVEDWNDYAPETVADLGFKFSHWSASEPDENGDIVVTAIFVKDESQYFDVIFLAGEHGAIIGTDSYPDILTGTAWTEIEVPTPDAEFGYKFIGWNVEFPETVTEDIVATALFAKDDTLWYTVEFVSSLGGYLVGTTVYTDILHGTDFSTIAVPEAVASADFTFIGWTPELPETVEGNLRFTAQFVNTAELDVVLDITDAYYEDGYITVIGSSKNVMDQWDVALKVFFDNGVENTATLVTVKYGDMNVGEGEFEYSIKVSPDDIHDDVYVEAKLVTVPVAADKEPVDYDLYTVSFVSTVGGTLNGITVYSGILEGTSWADAIIAVPEATASEGYTFIGWTPEFAETIDGNLTYTANFVSGYTMPFDVTEAIYNPKTGKLTVTGYAENAQDIWNVAIMVYANATVTEGVVEGDTVKVYTDSFGNIKTDNAGNFTAEFDVNAEALTGLVYVGGKYVEVTSELDTERVKTYLYFDKNAEDAVDGATTETTVYIGDEVVPNLTEDEPTREFYNFVEWAADAEGTAIADGTVVTAGGYTAYAKWAIVEHTVTFEDYDGTVIDTQTVEHGSAAVVPAAPEREDYIFAGWVDEDGTLVTDFSEITDDAVYTATYREANVSYVLEATEEWYLVNETLDHSTYELYRVHENGDRDLIDKSLYTVEALPTTDDSTYADCLGWQTLDVVFDDTAYGNVFEGSFDAFVVPDKLILEEESPLTRESVDGARLSRYSDIITDDITNDLIFNMIEGQTKQTVIDEFINMYFINAYTVPEDIDYEVRVVNADGSAYTALFVGTGAKVQLVIEGVVYDEVQIVVKGDADGNGMVNVADIRMIADYNSDLIAIGGVYYVAADADENVLVDVADIRRIADYNSDLLDMFALWNAASHVYSRDYSHLYSVTRG